MSDGKSSSQITLSKADYLKKYLSGGGDTDSGAKPKKLKKKVPASVAKSRVKVVDDDADSYLATSEAPKKLSANVFDDHDDASDPDEVTFRPTVADIIDERPEEVQILEKFSNSGKWKSVGDDRDKNAILMNTEGFKRKPSLVSVKSEAQIKVESQPYSSSRDDEPSAATIMLPDVRKSTAMRKAEEAVAIAKAKEDERKEKYSQWSKGLAQIAQQKERAEEAIKEMSKPLARYADDEDLERMLKEKDRIGDPMLAFKKSGKKYDDGETSANLAPSRPHRGPPNRFNIAPGLRWDGVDRSNGFERDLFLSLADRKTYREEEKLYAVEDW